MAPSGSVSAGQYACQNENTDLSKNPFEDVVATEPADPVEFNEQVRLSRPVAPLDTDVDKLPKYLVECGCANCPQRVDPLADEIIQDGENPFGDLLNRGDHYAANECPNAQPMSVARAADAVRVYQVSSYKNPDQTSMAEYVRQQHVAVLDSERQLLERWHNDVSTALLSLRIPPIESVSEGDTVPSRDYNEPIVKTDTGADTQTKDETTGVERRRWLPPVQIVNRLSDAWGNVRQVLSNHLSQFPNHEYLRVIAVTDSAGTPHMHVYLWVRDPDDELSVGHVEPAVQSFVSNAKGARDEHHPIEPNQRDAAIVETDPSRATEVDEDTLLAAMQRRECTDSGMELNTRGLHYILHQRPAWVIKDIAAGKVAPDSRPVQIELSGMATAKCSQPKWLTSSRAIDTS